MTISQPKSNEEEISLRVQVAIEKLDKVDADAEKEKRQIVQDLAKDLEGKIPTNRIANEIVHQLHGKKISPRTIRNCLDEKYKENYRVENARKQKRKESTEDLAALMPLEQEKAKQQIAATKDGKSVIIKETSGNTEASSISRTDESDSEKCPNCSEMEEALRKATTLSTADTLYSTPEILDLEFSLPYQCVQQYMAAEYRQGKSKVWFSVKINVKAKKVTSAKAGRTSESEVDWNDIH
jgi:hypothetical protein